MLSMSFFDVRLQTHVGQGEQVGDCAGIAGAGQPDPRTALSGPAVHEPAGGHRRPDAGLFFIVGPHCPGRSRAFLGVVRFGQSVMPKVPPCRCLHAPYCVLSGENI